MAPHDLRHPVIDRFTERRAIMLDSRPVIGMSSAVVDAVSAVAPTGRVLTLVTGPQARLTVPMRDLVASQVVQWVVQLPDGAAYDGLDGHPLRFDRVDFLPLVPEPGSETGPAAAFMAPRADGHPAWQVLVSMSVEHRPGPDVKLGRSVATVARALAGCEPSGWGLYEPVSEAWDADALTELVRQRLPETTRLIVTAGEPNLMVASLVVRATENGIEEEISGLVNVGPVDTPPSAIAARCLQALDSVAEHDVVGFGWTHLRPGRADLTDLPAARPASVPTALLIGPRAVHALGAESLRGASLPEPRVVGGRRVPGLLWSLGGDDGVSGWDQLADLVTYLTPQRIVSASPPLAAAINDGTQA